MARRRAQCGARSRVDTAARRRPGAGRPATRGPDARGRRPRQLRRYLVTLERAVSPTVARRVAGNLVLTTALTTTSTLSLARLFAAPGTVVAVLAGAAISGAGAE